ncbi:unnamed protein product (macronuclear) [Paramecium tetraurelia]|uniref:TNFR-Cys domain-containing protein n=1 Tax=Paramecium tetraurelia TaxID=5888 RepID=A0DMW6_PARTE|nr:uncharacterized protein GSPATT00018588001 [Paramecium tetraurelia]CAK84383.1 unnamed protein product [Paramecium tetraurelia]|eukprot:XP_001451780.1 hypothetical protein (macronuclear) [Paramecium tetraurelia strain d4-2]
MNMAILNIIPPIVSMDIIIMMDTAIVIQIIIIIQDIHPCSDAYHDSISSYTCRSCSQGYILKKVYTQYNVYRCFQLDWNCGFSSQSMLINYQSGGQIYYYTTCTLCDPGFLYNKQSKKCETIISKYQIKYCILLDSQGINCIACQAQYALQSDGTCKQIIGYCNSSCSTCLETNLNYCTSCIGWENRIAIDGICVCKPYHGLIQEMCTPCSDGYCFDCEDNDFYSCISCKPGSNRILVNTECICQPRSYDPGNLDQKCIVCDISCQKCNGPSYADCTECIEESYSNRVQNANLCPCKTGYGEFAIREAQCGKCHPKCETCFQAADDTDNQYCLTCIPGQNREVSENFYCDCKENYGDFGILVVCARIFINQTQFVIIHVELVMGLNLQIVHNAQLGRIENQQLQENACVNNHIMMIIQIIQNVKGVIIHVFHVQTVLKRMHVQNVHRVGHLFNQVVSLECICTAPNAFDDGFSLECQQCDETCKPCESPISSKLSEHATHNIGSMIYHHVFVLLDITILDNQNVQNATFLVTTVSMRRQIVAFFVHWSLALEQQKAIFVNVLMDIMKNQEFLSVKNAHINVKNAKYYQSNV